MHERPTLPSTDWFQFCIQLVEKSETSNGIKCCGYHSLGYFCRSRSKFAQYLYMFPTLGIRSSSQRSSCDKNFLLMKPALEVLSAAQITILS